uniref:Tumor protein p53-inducible protein 13 n=1 Tax=Sparus aurata TaxID=8175 RepID=A0A671X7L3_SPAAU
MPRETTSQPLTVAVLAALWVSLCRCDVSKSQGPVCDNGKLYLGTDLPKDAVYFNCPVSPWPESTQILPSIDTVYDPEPARQICMDRSISYNHTIPNSGAYRPVRAESGEYLYCPPQRWLNNLHHAATVLLYHPCAPLHERLLLSGLARSCLLDYIITPHLQLSNHTPIALVSWGRTLELSTVAAPDVCDWLESTTSSRNKFDAVSQSRKYNLLLTWSAEQPEELRAKTKGSVRRCCEQTISSLLSEEMESNMKKEGFDPIQGKSRQIRAALREKREKTAFDSVSKSQSESPLQPAGYLPSSRDCDGCKEGERCECNKDSGAEAQASSVNSGLPRTPRTDEAVWAAAALGFLLVLLTLSVLHTRLYRHWRTTPSLYWHDPQMDYDSVADVIRRRLRIAKRRRKRGRRQECVLLPSSSSSDEHP